MRAGMNVAAKAKTAREAYATAGPFPDRRSARRVRADSIKATGYPAGPTDMDAAPSPCLAGESEESPITTDDESIR
jgi:hypothetical protein